MSLFLVLTRTDKLLPREAVAFDQHLSTTTPLHEPRPWQPPFSSVSMNLAFLDSTYKWYHSVFVFLCLTYFILHNAHKILPCCHICVCVCVCELSLVQPLSHVRLFATPWTTAHQASLSINNSQRLLKLRSIEWVMASNHLILCHPLLLLPSIFPSSGSFPMSQFFASGGQSIGASSALLKKLQSTELCNQKAQNFFRSLRIPEP